MVGLVAEIAELTNIPLIAQPNAGMPELVGGRTAYGEDASFLAANLMGLHRAGARIIGGCCGTTSKHIRAVRRFADALQPIQ